MTWCRVKGSDCCGLGGCTPADFYEPPERVLSGRLYVTSAAEADDAAQREWDRWDV
jgi:hypothetical protein